MVVTNDTRAKSHLLKAREFLLLLEQQQQNGLPSMSIALAQDAAEQAFRAILFARGISRQADHRPDLKAEGHKDTLLVDIWPELAPLAADYSWLWHWRNQARYSHADAPPVAEPEITPEVLQRATTCARALSDLAEKTVVG